MAIAASTLWEFNASSTANMANGGGFNYLNSNYLTDGVITSPNTSAPTLSSATYAFFSGDVGCWVYFPSTTYPGFYQIDSVVSGVATLNASSGSGVMLNTTTEKWGATTNIGVSSSSSTLTSQSFLVDYSQVATAIVDNTTTFSAAGGSTTLTSLADVFSPAMVGNFFHQTTSGTGGFGLAGWYEIVSYTDETTVTLDRTPNNGTASSGCAGYVGGALSLNSSLDDDFFEIVQGGNTVFFKSGTYTLGEALAVTSLNSTGTSPSNSIGYTSIRGDSCTGTSRPTIACGANVAAFAQYHNLANLIFTGTGTPVLTGGTGAIITNVKASQSSTTAGRMAITVGTDGIAFNCEAISQLGRAFNASVNNARYFGCYAHNSAIGFYNASSRNCIFQCLISACSTNGIVNGNNTFYIGNCTVYGFASPSSSSVGVSILASIDSTYIFNNIISGWVTGVAGTTSQRRSNKGGYNCFYGNTTNATLYSLDQTDITTNPSFTSVTELSGSTATTSGSILTQSGGDFSSVTDNVDYVFIVSGTGVTVGMYLITSHTSTTITLNNAPGTNATADKVWKINTGKNLGVGTNMKAAAFPGAFPGSSTTSYLDIGAVQRQEPAGGGSGGSFTFAG